MFGGGFKLPSVLVCATWYKSRFLALNNIIADIHLFQKHTVCTHFVCAVNVKRRELQGPNDLFTRANSNSCTNWIQPFAPNTAWTVLPVLARLPARPLLPLCTPLISGTRKLFHITHASPPSLLRADVTEKSCQLWGFPTAVRSLSSGWKSAVSMAASARSHPPTLPSSSSSQTSFLGQAICFQVDRRTLEELKQWRKKGRKEWTGSRSSRKTRSSASSALLSAGLVWTQSVPRSKRPF